MLKHHRHEPFRAIGLHEQIAALERGPINALDIAIQVNGATNALEVQAIEFAKVGRRERLDLTPDVRNEIVFRFACAIGEIG